MQSLFCNSMDRRSNPPQRRAKNVPPDGLDSLFRGSAHDLRSRCSIDREYKTIKDPCRPMLALSRQLMYPHQPSNAQENQDYGRRRMTFPSSSSPAQTSNSPYARYSPYGENQLLCNAPALYHPLQLQPPSAPRIQNIPLPGLSCAHSTSQAPRIRRDVFPIDLTNDVDFELLADGIGNFPIPLHATVYVMPSSRERSLLQITTGNRPARAFSVIRRVQSIIRAPLSLEVYLAQLQPAVQVSVREYFLSQSGSYGAQLWQEFLNGAQHPQGPKGVILLQGHIYMWGFSQDHFGKWVLHVDAPTMAGL
ncbi:hypothetical protein B0H19DRAFT_714251 [Mycena capillaripes]|nr:hypothetical protein B0H19DRAFT_714251 [Mycena capillaripes]